MIYNKREKRSENKDKSDGDGNGVGLGVGRKGQCRFVAYAKFGPDQSTKRDLKDKVNRKKCNEV